MAQQVPQPVWRRDVVWDGFGRRLGERVGRGGVASPSVVGAHLDARLRKHLLFADNNRAPRAKGGCARINATSTLFKLRHGRGPLLWRPVQQLQQHQLPSHLLHRNPAAPNAHSQHRQCVLRGWSAKGGMSRKAIRSATLAVRRRCPPSHTPSCDDAVCPPTQTQVGFPTGALLACLSRVHSLSC